MVFDQDYLPFGGDLAVVGDLEPQNDVGESYKYTGQRQETSIGLYYYGARFYDPELGRFISEDSYAGELVNPQSGNIYIYTLNNPMRYVDPKEHFVEEYDEEYGYSTAGIVGEGDTLSNIALNIYGNESAAEALANMNNLEDIDSIYEGQNLLLPGVAYDGSSGAYMQPGFMDGAREVPDAFIALTTLGTAGLEAGGLEALTAVGSSAYAAADKAIEKGYYWASDKLARLQTAVGSKVGRLFNRGTGNPAHSVAQYQKLKESLAVEEIQSVTNTTKHGAERLLQRGFTPNDINVLKISPDKIMKQGKDGASVFIKMVKNGKYNVIVEGENGVVTALKNIGQKALERLSENYQWR